MLFSSLILTPSAEAAISIIGRAVAVGPGGAMAPGVLLGGAGVSNTNTTSSGVPENYALVISAIDTSTQQEVQITSLNSLSVTVGSSSTVSTFSVLLNSATIAPVGSGSPVLYLYNSGGTDITAPYYGQSYAGTSFGSGTVTDIVLNDLRVAPSLAGGIYNLDVIGETQSVTFSVSANTIGGAASGTFMATTNLVAVPEPLTGGSAVLGFLGLAAIRRRRN